MYLAPGCTPEIIPPPVIATIKIGLLYEISYFLLAMTLYDIIHSIKSSFSDGNSEDSVQMGSHFTVYITIF